MRHLREQNKENASRFFELVQLAMGRFVVTLGAEEMFRLYRMRSTDTLFVELRDRVFNFDDPHFCKALQEKYPKLDVSEQFEFIRLLGLWFVIDGLMGHETIMACCDPAAYEVGLVIHRMVNPLMDRWTAEQVTIQREKLSKEFISPDKALEPRTDLSPYNKAGVFNNSLIARNNRGYLELSGRLDKQPVQFHAGIPRAACRFFEANPNLSVADLNLVLDRCVETAHTQCSDENDPYAHARKGGENIGYFLTHFGTIINELGMTREFPGLRCLSSQELFGKDGHEDREEQ
jgi:hypothetical protein